MEKRWFRLVIKKMNLINIIILTLTVFCIGIWGILINRRNLLILLMSFEIMYLGASINIAFFCFTTGEVSGLIFVLYILTIVGAESCVGLSIIALYYAIHKDVSLNTMDLLRH
jgi:NADH-quinone oxidoreductase subunit K